MQSREQIAQSFDRRAAAYAKGDWHREAAERLVELCPLPTGGRVLDAATGTGFAAVPAARAVGPTGHVVGVDLSAGMLREAATCAGVLGVTNIEFQQGDATALPQSEHGIFDAVICASGLLYMPIAAALAEWYRVLRPAGTLAVSEMAAGSPPAATLFRDLAATCGVALTDPCAALGTEAAMRDVLATGRFEVIAITAEPVAFSTTDFDQAWEANFRSPGHAAVLQLPDASQRALRERYLDALRRLEREAPHHLNESQIVYAVGRKPAS